MATDGSCEMPGRLPNTGGDSIRALARDLKIDRVDKISPSTTAIGPCAASSRVDGDQVNVHEGLTW